MISYPVALWLFATLALVGPVVCWKMGRISGADQMRRDLLSHPSIRAHHTDNRIRQAA